MSDVLMPETPARSALRPAPVEEAGIPLGLLAEITHRCPLQCPYCSNPVELERPAGELTAAEWARVFAEAAALGVVQLHISGGEPLARRDIVDIVAAARSAGLYSNLITAAVNLSPERADALVEAGIDHVQISIQDVTEDGCDLITKYPGALRRKIAAARLVVERGLPLTVNSVVHRHNLDRVDRMIALAEELGAHRIEIANTQYYGWAYLNRSALMPTREQVDRASGVIARERERLKGRMLIDYVVPDYYARFPKPCMGGWASQFLNVTPTGTVLPCHAAASIPGLSFESVRDRSLAAIWRESDAFNAFRGTGWMREPCLSCPRKLEDFGGCRCQAFLITGDARNADPVCSLSPHHGRMLDLTAEPTAGAMTDFRYRRYG